MDLTEIIGMDPIGQLRTNLHDGSIILDSTEMICMVLMMPEVAQGLDPVDLCQLLTNATSIHSNHFDLVLMCTRCLGNVLEFVPNATQRACSGFNFAEQSLTLLESQIQTCTSPRKNEWLEEMLRILNRLVLQGETRWGYRLD